MAKTLLFRTVLRKLMGNTTKLIFSLSAQWFSQNISFFNLLSDLFSIIAKKINQIRTNIVPVVTPLVFVYCCALTMDVAMFFNVFSGSQKKWEFYDP